MDIGFGVSAVAMAMGLVSLVCGTGFYRNKPPRGSILAPIAQGFCSCNYKEKTSLSI
ncbi:hypothetical protein CASFOL_014607 [Castilleja foliolosa]|uniref:Uncharacterized protein n=1 Tax=Castilleja foliolosa TaxID=1961234 RepID=A0ABD3DQA1_9LAMI